MNLQTYTKDNLTSMILRLLAVALIGAPVIGYLFDRFTRYQGFNLVINNILFLGAILLILTSMNKRIKFDSLFWFLIVYYLISSIIDALNFNQSLFSSKDITRNQSLAAAFFILIIDNSNISKEFYLTLIKVLWFIFISSIAVILYQHLFNPYFLTSHNSAVYTKGDEYVSSIQSRYSSFFGLVGSESNGFTFNAIYGVILNNVLKKKRNVLMLMVFCGAFLFCFLTRARWIIVYFLIISAQIMFFYKPTNLANWVKYSRLIIALLVLLILMMYIGIPVVDTILYRYLDKDKGGITEGSLKAREYNYRLFSRFFGKGMWLGLAMSGYRTEYYQELGRASYYDLIGLIYPLVSYGILGSMFLYIFYLVFLFRLYYFGVRTGNYSYFLMILGLLVSCMSIGNFSIIDMGFLLALILYNYERRDMVQRMLNRNAINVKQSLSFAHEN